MADSRLTIGRMSTTYVVPRGHPAPEELRRRGDEALRGPVAAALADRLRRLAPDEDGTIWIIRQLFVDFPFAAERADVRELGAVWGREIVESLTRAIRAGEGVTRFPSRAAYLAQYVFDVATGRDSGCWYYAQFDSLAALPAGANIREALVREPALAGEVLVELARAQRLEPVLIALSDRGAAAVYEAAFPSEEIAELSPRIIEVLLALGDALAERGDDGSIATPKNAIRLTTALLVDGIAARPHVDRLLGLASMLAGAAEPWRVVEALIDGDARAAIAAARSPDLPTIEAFIHLAATRPDLVTCAAGTLKPSTVTLPRKEEVALPSEHAGLALLLEPLAEVAPEDAAMRRAVAELCAGEEIAGDPILDLIVAPRMKVLCGGGLLARRKRRRSRRFLVDVLRRFATHLFGFADSSIEYLRANFLAGPGSIVIHQDEVIVNLPEVPLEVVLRLAGFDGKRVVVPWLPDRTITLRLGGHA